jgi:hypothetical protein
LELQAFAVICYGEIAAKGTGNNPKAEKLSDKRFPHGCKDVCKLHLIYTF